MRYIVSLLIGLGLIILVIVLLFRAIFGGGNSETGEKKTDLLGYSNTATAMRLTIDGPVNADQEHQRIRIRVGSDQVNVQLLSGYENRVVKQQNFNNNSQAYANFLRAIDLLGYTKGDKAEALKDERGQCPSGSRYIYEILDGQTEIQRYWATSCNQTQSFKGEFETINQLFQAQVPEYEQQTSDFELN